MRRLTRRVVLSSLPMLRMISLTKKSGSRCSDRNASEHMYDSALAKRLVTAILDRYIPEFEYLLLCLIDLYDEELLESL